MKISAALLPLAMGNYTGKELSNYGQAMMQSLAERDQPSKTRSNIPCPVSDLGADGIDNALQPVINEARSGKSYKAKFMCKSMYFPAGPSKASHCVKKNGVWSWTNSFAENSCVTCYNRPDEIDIDVDQIDCQAHKGNPRKTVCKLECENSNVLSHPQMLGYKTRSSIQTICSCSKDEGSGSRCIWTMKLAPGVTEVGTPKKYSCRRDEVVGRPSKFSNTDDECSAATKDPTCFYGLERYIKPMNSWDCKNCFRIRFEYRMKALGIKNWTNKDYIDIQFDNPVAFLRTAYPVKEVVDVTRDGKQKPGTFFRITFS